MSDNGACSLVTSESEAERKLKDAWIDAYVKDFNNVQACHRVGIPESEIGQTILAFENDPYVVDALHEKMRTMNEADVVTRSEVLNHLKYMAFKSPSEDTRLKAWDKLSKLMGMEVLHVKTERVDGADLPTVNENMTVQQIAEIYANEVLYE